MRKIWFCLFCVSLGAAGFGQETGEASGGERRPDTDYRVTEEGKIVQTLAWDRSNAYFYEVELQRRNAAEQWEGFLKERTEENFLEVSLSPGMYRYRIVSYNVLGRAAAVSDWSGIRIYPAREPVVESFSPPAFFVDSRQETFTLTLRGADLMEEARVYIIAKTEAAKPAESRSAEHGEDGAVLSAVFSAEGLVLGDYDIVVINPGGLRSVTEGFTVSFEKPLDLSASLGYAPLLPLYGGLFQEYDRPFYPLGFYGRFSALPLKRLWGSIGGDFQFRFINMTTRDDRFVLRGQMLLFSLHGLYQKWFRDYTMALGFRLGGAYAPMLNMRFEHRDGSNSSKETLARFALGGGVLWQWQVWQGLFVEAGLDYLHFAASPGPGFLQASAGLGWKF
jgi:hypothetical protein